MMLYIIKYFKMYYIKVYVCVCVQKCFLYNKDVCII